MVRWMALSGLLAAQIGLAAPVYKVIGPDGKISFTDQPPASAVTQEIKAPVNQAKVVELERDPKVAAVTVYAKQIIVETGSRFCTMNAPSTTHAVLAARDAWRERNVELTEKKNRVMARLMSFDERTRLAQRSERENEAVLDKMRAAPLAEKLKWCQAVPVNFAAQELDPSRNPTLVRALREFDAK